MFWKYFFIIYGVLCLFIGLVKPPFIFNMSKIKFIEKIFGGQLGARIFIIIWGGASLAIGILVF